MSIYPYVSSNRCLFCNGDILIKRSRDKNNKYCSTICVGKHTRTKIKDKSICINCGKIFDKRWGDKNFYCNRKCQIDYRHKNKKVNERICKRCGKKFYPINVTYSRIQNVYCSSECSARKYDYDDDYFKYVDNEEKAYWLGFIYADGNVYKTTLTIKLNKKDKEHISLFKNHIKSEHPIKDIKRNQSFIQVNGKKLTSQLNNLGVMSRKTFKIDMPKLREDLYNDFIRGYFDGDGCMYVTEKYHTFSIYTASDIFKKSIIDFFKSKLNIKLNENGSSLSKSKIKNLVDIYHFLYDKPDIVFLKRKKDKFEKIFIN